MEKWKTIYHYGLFVLYDHIKEISYDSRRMKDVNIGRGDNFMGKACRYKICGVNFQILNNNNKKGKDK